MFELIALLSIICLYILLTKNPITVFFRSKIRRFFALQQAERFIIDTFPTYKLRNDNVILIYNDRRLEITCIDRNNENKKTLVSKKNYQVIVNNFIDDYIRSDFDELCSVFNSKTTYEYILNYMEWNFATINSESESNEQPMTNFDIYVEQQYSKYMSKNNPNELYQYRKKKYRLQTEQIDINTADEKEIAKLPGINIILAKKIVQYRNLNNGFKSKNEFYKEMNIKPHFKKQIDSIIAVSEFKWKESNTDNNERTIDF